MRSVAISQVSILKEIDPSITILAMIELNTLTSFT